MIGAAIVSAACTSGSQRTVEQAWPASAVTDGDEGRVFAPPQPVQVPAPAYSAYTRPGGGSAAPSTRPSTKIWRLQDEKRQLQGAINTYDRQLQSYDRGQAGLRPTPADRIAERRPREDPQDRRRDLERRALEDQKQAATATINRLEYERRLGVEPRARSSSSARYRGGLRSR